MMTCDNGQLVGDSCTVTCEAGFSPVDASTVCQSGNIFSPPPQCSGK